MFRIALSSAILYARCEDPVREMMDIQLQEDMKNMAFTPNFDLVSGEFVYIPTKGGRQVHFYSTVTRHRDSMVFGMSEEPKYLIKYRHNCHYSHSIHPLVRDYHMMTRLSPLGVTVRALSLSPPVPFGEARNHGQKGDFAMSDIDWFRCDRNPNADVRYMIYERPEGSVFDLILSKIYYDGDITFQSSMQMLRNLIAKLRIMHNQGIVHRNIHPGTIVRFESSGELGFIDFSHSLLVSELSERSEIVRPPVAYARCMESPFEIEGFRSSFRDDVFRAVFSVAFAMQGVTGGPNFIRFCKWMESDPVQMIQWKRNDFFFQFPDGLIFEDLLPPTQTMEVKAEIRTHMERILTLVRSDGVKLNDLPPYDEIIAEIDVIQALLLQDS
jgi:serine/threonine protein kinase